MYRPATAALLASILQFGGGQLALAQSSAVAPPLTIDGPPAPMQPAVVSRDDTGRATLRAIRLQVPLNVDGKLDEQAYTIFPSVSDFIQQEPHEGEPATEKTEAWIFFDDKNIYVAGRCCDSHPERMVVNEMRRDSNN